ncbi:sugar phosphate isomerase/epimerase family protein [Amycolatopsis kentuckyensis]|uniref:sugar phosphate isomerase/epimerase family protein n=1 Tax=Amycolatopsis kentuckyensis TaxID=218823 RepID=UPI0013027A4C|nr:TIM barrel protein [Amycolatopsis kentuckyensis]
MTPCLLGLAEWRLPAAGAEAVHRTAAAGAGGLQLDFGGPGRGEWLDAPGRVRAVRDAAVTSGVRLLAVAGNHLNDVGLTTAPARPIVERLLDAAHALEVPLVFLPSFRRSAIDGPAAFERTARVLAWAAAEAEARGLRLASENVLAPHRATELAERVGSPAFRLLLDTFNPVKAGLRPEALVAGAGPLLADQVHLKDGPPDVGATPALGDGTGRVHSTLDALREHAVPVRALVLENDYRDGDPGRLATDLAWARRRARWFSPPAAVGGRGGSPVRRPVPPG